MSVDSPGQTNNSSLTFQCLPLRFEFQAKEPIYFPPGKAANVIRGALGHVFRRIVCEPYCPGAKTCPRALECAYARMFEPRAHGVGPSGLEDQPRPFVLRAAVLDGRRFQPAEQFTLDVNVFDLRASVFQYFRLAFVQLWRDGLGPGRARVELVDAQQLSLVRLSLLPNPESVRRLKIRFLTPTELKHEGRNLREPRFDVLFARARDRVSALCSIYQRVSLNLDFRGMGERARQVRLISSKIEQVEFERRSSRAGQWHGLGGFIGEAEYEGENLGEFEPFLRAASWSGVGRLTVWGRGCLYCEISAP